MVDEAVYIEKITKIKRKQWIEWATIEEESIERDITNAFKDGEVCYYIGEGISCYNYLAMLASPQGR